MSRFPFTFVCFLLATLLFGGSAKAQYLLAIDLPTDSVVAFSPVDGSVISLNPIAVDKDVGILMSAIEVNGEVWVSSQINDRIVRYDSMGNVLGIIGPSFPGGGFDNIRGMTLFNGEVWVTNDGANNGATADSLVRMDAAGNHISTIPLSNTVSPYNVIPWQGGILVAGSSNNEDVHRYSLTGTSLGTFHNSALSFTTQLCPSSDGNVWCTSSSVVAKLDANTGAILSSFPASGSKGVFELQNGNVMWTNGTGFHVHDIVASTSTTVFAGSGNHLNLGFVGRSHHLKHGSGCFSFRVDNSNLFQLFDSMPNARLALEGNAIRFTPAGNGYVANWLAGAAVGTFITPTGGATIVADVATGQETFTPSTAIPIPCGATSTWTVSTEGILTAGSVGNQGSDTIGALGDITDELGLAFYSWFPQNPAEAGSGKIKWEEVGGILCVTFEGVEYSGSTPSVAPSTFQWQIDMATGEVTMLWVSLSIATSTTDVLVGCTLAGAGATPGSQALSSVVAEPIQPDDVLAPMTLTAAPAPIINPSTLVTYTVENVPELLPGSGLYFSTLFLSLSPVPTGIDLTGFLTVIPGCRLYIGSLDVNFGTALNGTPTNAATFTFSAPPVTVGLVIGAQAVGLFDTSVPLLNGETSGFTLSNGVRSVLHLQ